MNLSIVRILSVILILLLPTTVRSESFFYKAINTLIFSHPDAVNKKCQKNCKIGERGLTLVRTYEGYSPFTYICPAGYPTIGYGHVVLKTDKIVEPLMPEAANELLRKDMAKFEGHFNKLTHVKVKQNQADAVISLIYNIGPTNYSKSTLLKKINAEAHKEVPPQIMRWVYAGKKKLNGLVRRREAEASLYAE